MRQAMRELLKTYIHDPDSAAPDDVFELLVWNQGIGYFSSEIAPSTFFAAYTFIKQTEKKKLLAERYATDRGESSARKTPISK